MLKTTSEQTVLLDIVESWAEAVRRKDIDGVVAHHAPDMLMFDVVPPLQARGLEAYRRSWIDLFFPWYGQNGRFDLSEVNVVAGEGAGFATGLIHCAGTENDKRVEFTLRLTVGFEKRNGVWTVVHEHHSEPLKP
jgi:ketosteroid isomerase-like protein